MDPLKPGITLLAKLGSIAGHVDEGLSPDAHEFDWTAARSVIEDPEVQEWLHAMRAKAFVMRPRRPVGATAAKRRRR